jgi:hypothetical protein
MIHFPWYPFQGNGFQKINDILSPIVVGDTLFVLGHEYDRHIREKWGNGLPESGGADGVLGDRLFYGYESKFYALLNNNGSVKNHGNLL